MKTMSVKFPDRLHARARSLAREDGMSLNQFLVTSVAHEVTRQETLDFFQQAAKGYSTKSFADALAAVPDIPLDECDRLE